MMSLSTVEQALVDKLTERFSSLHEAFLSLDKGKEGRLSAEGLVEALEELGLRVDAQTIDALIHKYDDGTGRFDFAHFSKMNEFRCSMLDSTSHRELMAATVLKASDPSKPHTVVPESEEHHRALLLAKVRSTLASHRHSGTLTSQFLHFDVMRTGYLTYSEVIYGLAQYGVELTPQELMLLIRPYCDKLNGVISMPCFFALITGDEPDSSSSSLNETPLPKGSFSLIPDSAQDKVAISKIVDAIDAKKLALRQAFMQMDTEKNGRITEEQFRSGLEKLGLSISDAKCRQIFEAYDFNHDGFFYYYEFVRMISSVFANTASEYELQATRARHELTHAYSSPAVLMNESTIPPQQQLQQQLQHQERYVSESEVLATLAHISEAVFDKYNTMKQCFVHFDKSHSGTITLEELDQGLKEVGVTLSPEDLKTILARFDAKHLGALNYPEFVRLLSASQTKL